MKKEIEIEIPKDWHAIPSRLNIGDRVKVSVKEVIEIYDAEVVAIYYNENQTKYDLKVFSGFYPSGEPNLPIPYIIIRGVISSVITKVSETAGGGCTH